MAVQVPFAWNEGFNPSNMYVIYEGGERTLRIAPISVTVINIALHAKLLGKVHVLLKLRSTNLQLLNNLGLIVPSVPTNYFTTNSRDLASKVLVKENMISFSSNLLPIYLYTNSKLAVGLDYVGMVMLSLCIICISVGKTAS